MSELLLILVVALLVVGPDKLPQAARAIGKGIRDLRRTTQDLQDTIEKDEQLGEAVRELKGALHGDPRSLRPPVRRPPPTPPAIAPAEPVAPGALAAAGAGVSPAVEPAGPPRVVANATAIAKGDAIEAASPSGSPAPDDVGHG